jgi:hypothetical protein
MDIYILDVISRIWIYIWDFGNLGTNVANGSIRILTLDITSRIHIQILVIRVPMLQMDRSENRVLAPREVLHHLNSRNWRKPMLQPSRLGGLGLLIA